jgi:hypothetical protein
MIPTTKYSSVTNEHPRDKSGVAVDVTRETAKDLAVGHVGGDADVELVETGDGEGYIRVKFVVDDPDTIDQVNDKVLVELSPKYQCEYRAVAGEHPVHGKYDGVQLSRDVNAVALTRRGRGSAVFVRADSAYQEILMSTTRKDRADEESAMAGMSEELITALAEKIAEKIASMMAASEAPAEEASDSMKEEEEAKADEMKEEEEAKADEHSPEHKAEEEEEEADSYKKDEADSAFLDAFARRSRILDAAQRHGVSVSDDDQRLSTNALLARVARQALPQDLHARADSDPAFAEGALCTQSASDRRHDGLGVVSRADTGDKGYEDPWERGLKTRRKS